jgi:hypothetical protein
MTTSAYGTQQRSVQQLHGKKSVVAVAVEFMHPNDIRMRQQLQMLELALQLGEKFLPLGNRRMQNFDRYPLARGGHIEAILVDRLEHGAHAALPEHSADSITPTQQIAYRHFLEFAGFLKLGARNRWRLPG